MRGRQPNRRRLTALSCEFLLGGLASSSCLRVVCVIEASSLTRKNGLLYPSF